jgi:hypothetical protein
MCNVLFITAFEYLHKFKEILAQRVRKSGELRQVLLK